MIAATRTGDATVTPTLENAWFELSAHRGRFATVADTYRGLLVRLARVARDEAIEHLYLQVERDNATALALYAAAMFREAYGYHYRVLDRAA